MWNFPGICSLLWTKWSILWVRVAYRLPFCTLCFKVVFSCLKARKKWQGIAWCPKSLAFGNRKSWLQLGPMLCLTLDKSLSKFWFPCNTAKSLNILLLPFFFFFFLENHNICSGKATHSSVLAWRIPQIQSMGSQRAGHDWLSLSLWIYQLQLVKKMVWPWSLWNFHHCKGGRQWQIIRQLFTSLNYDKCYEKTLGATINITGDLPWDGRRCDQERPP